MKRRTAKLILSINHLNRSMEINRMIKVRLSTLIKKEKDLVHAENVVKDYHVYRPTSSTMRTIYVDHVFYSKCILLHII